MAERSTEELEYKSAHAQPEEKTPYTPRPKSHIILAWVLTGGGHADSGH